MNEFARWHSGDDIFRRVMIGVTIGGAIFMLYLMSY
jgi:hypothetical protein